MNVKLLDGLRYEDLSPVRPSEDFKPPRPSFWAKDMREVLCRGLRRLACTYHRGAVVGVLPGTYGAVEFGWGDAGETNVAVYRPVGKVRMSATKSEMTITVAFWFGRSCVDAIEFTCGKDDWDMAQHILLQAMLKQCYGGCRVCSRKTN